MLLQKTEKRYKLQNLLFFNWISSNQENIMIARQKTLRETVNNIILTGHFLNSI